MDSTSTSQSPSQYAFLVAHLSSFEARQRTAMAGLYGAPSAEAKRLADFIIAHPERVREAVREEISGSLGWRVIEEAALEHDLGVELDWVPARQQRTLERLGLLRITSNEQGQSYGVMPGVFAAIFAEQADGQRGSLPLLLGRSTPEHVAKIAANWGLSTEGSTIEQIVLICDFFSRDDMVEDLLDALPNENWVGDAMMVMELGGLCYWQQIYGYDFEEHSRQGDNVVPLMRRDERRHQQEVAETLLDLGVLFRLEEADETEHAMIAAPEELWGGLWDLGLRWLMDWTAQSMTILEDLGSGRAPQKSGAELRTALKWLVCESESRRLTWDKKTGAVAEKSRQELGPVYQGADEPQWENWWELGKELRILSPSLAGEVLKDFEAESLLDRSRGDFVREVLLEWCIAYSGRSVDQMLPEAIGLDEAWRVRATNLLRRQAEMIPVWMSHSGVDSTTTGGGWLREPGTGPDDMVVFEAVITTAFVLMTKLAWLDLLSLLESERQYPVNALVDLVQCIASQSMFTQLGLVLEQQPAAVYLPFQRSSFLMDQLHHARFHDWVRDIIEKLFIPLGVAVYSDDKESVWLETSLLRIKTPSGWPASQRLNMIADVYSDEVEFELPPERESGIREVAPVAEADENLLSIELPLEELLEAVRGREILSFDGRFLRVR